VCPEPTRGTCDPSRGGPDPKRRKARTRLWLLAPQGGGVVWCGGGARAKSQREGREPDAKLPNRTHHAHLPRRRRCLAFLMPARAHAPLVVAGPRARRRNVTTAANPTNGPTGRLDPINRSPASLPVRNLPCPADDDRNQQPVARSRSEEASDWLEGQPVSQGIDRAGIDGAL
jgi:hypothetical protein